MAVVSRLSGNITNRDASPRVKNNEAIEGGFLHEAIGYVAATNGDSIASVYRFAQIPSNARISEILVSCADLGTTTAADFGLYRTTEDGGAVVDVDRFASALSLSSGALAKVESLLESGNIVLADMEKMVWEMLGLSADPGYMYDIAATLTGACDGSGSLVVQARYQK